MLKFVMYVEPILEESTIQIMLATNRKMFPYFLWMNVVLICLLIFFCAGYKDLQARKETREAAWRSPGWDECVAYTVPLIREMHCRILAPTSFSPTQ